MPTGYRPQDVASKNPIKTIQQPDELKKYQTENSRYQLGWGYFQLVFTLGLIFHLFWVENNFDSIYLYLYAGIIFTNIFSYTSLLDNSKIVYLSEFIKLCLIGVILWKLDFLWFDFSQFQSNLFLTVQIIFSIIYLFPVSSADNRKAY